MAKKSSRTVRKDAMFLRNGFEKQGKFGIPLVKKQHLNTYKISLIACSNTKSHDSRANRAKGVHFFKDDYHFYGVYNNPNKSLKKFRQYAFMLTPDFSTYAEMDTWRQIESVAHSRWCGAFWQSKGLTVIPTITWSTPRSFEFCFDGVERGSIVAVGTVGCRRSRKRFLDGYDEMLRRIQPEAVICFGKPFTGMKGNVIPVEYKRCGKVGA